ncbi:UNVERIFIED_CONTAM: putative E3 ubiquitin-protein ligase LIN-1 [Sesamum radiatum]|uniref:E3 ubiquitin-protein ligase LIN-1 n=1 Tax=Sesamum radiatum TaxID=300843 RepID=A0AAW2PYP1_SESRA
MSIYREEAMEALLEALQRKDFPSSQIMALRMLSSLSGHLGASRKPYMESWLLKIAGFDQPYNAMMRGEETKTSNTELAAMKEEEKATRTWEKRMAFVLTNHERGMVFKSLEECFKSNSIEIAKSCLVVATWLVYMLYSFPDCGIRDVACKSLLDKFINVLQSSKNLEEKILAALALRGFISEPGGLQEMGYMPKVWKTLRRLKKNCIVVHDIMKALMNLPSIDAADLWSCVEGPELDVSINGEILSMIHIRNRLISSHSDGTIKVWDTGKSTPRLIQEAREHSKAVTCLYVPPACDKLYSGSLDKTIRVWSIKQEEIHCIQVHDVKEAVLALAANASFACFSLKEMELRFIIGQGFQRALTSTNKSSAWQWMGKNFTVVVLATLSRRDLGTHTSSTFYSGAKKLLGKQTIYAVEIHNGLLYASGSSVDGIAGKVFKLSSKAVIGTLPAGLDIQQTAVNNDFIFTASKCGTIEVWLKDRLTKIAYIKTGSRNARITSIASDAHGQKLFAGTSDGRLQANSTILNGDRYVPPLIAAQLNYLLATVLSRQGDVIYNAMYPLAAPDIIFGPEDESFQPVYGSNGKSRKSSLADWNSKDPARLLSLLSSSVLVCVKSVRVVTDIDQKCLILLPNCMIQIMPLSFGFQEPHEWGIEMYMTSGTDKVVFPVGKKQSTPPPPRLKLVSSAELKAIFSIEDFRLPPWLDGMCTAEYLPTLEEMLESQVVNIFHIINFPFLNRLKMQSVCRTRRKFITALVPLFGRPIEADPVFCRRATFLASSGVFTFLVHFSLSLQFPKQQPGLILQSSQHFNSNGMPVKSPNLAEYPWSPRWESSEMADRIFDFLVDECLNFKKYCNQLNQQ